MVDTKTLQGKAELFFDSYILLTRATNELVYMKIILGNVIKDRPIRISAPWGMDIVDCKSMEQQFPGLTFDHNVDRKV